jgi:hypothetical protein
MREAQVGDAPKVVATLGRFDLKTGSVPIVITNIESVGALLDALTDEYSRRIVSCAMARGRTVVEICSEQQIPSSTCYKKVKQFVKQGVMIVERRGVPGRGRWYAIYRSTFTYLSIEMKNAALSVRVVVNPDIADNVNYDRLARRWREIGDAHAAL